MNLSWTFPSKYPKGQTWYVIAGAIMLGLTFFSFIVGWYMMGVVIIIFCGVYMLFEINAADEVSVTMTPEGVQVGNEFFEIAKIRQFGIIYVYGKPTVLRLVLAKKVSPVLDLGIPEDISATQLRDFLLPLVAENEEMEFTFVEHLMYLFRI